MQKRCIVNEGLLRMRQFCFSPSSIDRRCFNEEQVWLNGRDRLNSATRSACLLLLSVFSSSFFLTPEIAWRFCDSFSAVSFFCFSSFSRTDSKDDRDRRARSPAIHQMDKFYWIMYLPCDSGHLCETFAFKGNQEHCRLR